VATGYARVVHQPLGSRRFRPVASARYHNSRHKNQPPAPDFSLMSVARALLDAVWKE
jgi:hypothetical protein